MVESRRNSQHDASDRYGAAKYMVIPLPLAGSKGQCASCGIQIPLPAPTHDICSTCLTWAAVGNHIEQIKKALTEAGSS